MTEFLLGSGEVDKAFSMFHLSDHCAPPSCRGVSTIWLENGTEVRPNMEIKQVGKDGCGLPPTSVPGTIPTLVVQKGRLQLGPCDMP